MVLMTSSLVYAGSPLGTRVGGGKYGVGLGDGGCVVQGDELLLSVGAGRDYPTS